jgi:SAM-dependent methyltransferase
VATVQASAEATGLSPALADLATAAQSFHWFDREAALTEMARIVRPGGGVAIFWNTRDADASPFLADYRALLDRYVEGAGTDRDREAANSENRALFAAHRSFGDAELVEIRHVQVMTAAQFLGLAFTASYVRILPPEEQDRFRIELAGALGRHGHRDETPFEVPYRIDCWIARRQEP